MSATSTTQEGGGLPLQNKLDSLEEGDKILINDRKQPITVLAIKQYEFDEGDAYTVLHKAA